MDSLLSALEDRPGLIGSVSGGSRSPPEVSSFRTSPLEIRVEHINQRANVAGYRVVECTLEIGRADHAARLHPAGVGSR
jgi:hypothetical protein